VTFAGYVPHADLPDWYRAANLTVLPSRSEGVPNVLLESIACGTPFVASRVGGIPEVADPLVDRLVAPNDRDALADAIVHSLTSPSRITRRTMPVSTVNSAEHLLALLTSVVTAYRGSPMKTREAGVPAGVSVRVQP
jgi:glycosyltransferase involved in cell wall biosynthesis